LVPVKVKGGDPSKGREIAGLCPKY